MDSTTSGVSVFTLTAVTDAQKGTKYFCQLDYDKEAAGAPSVSLKSKVVNLIVKGVPCEYNSFVLDIYFLLSYHFQM